MLARLIDFSLKNKFVVIAATIAMVLGSYTLNTMNG